MAGLGWRLGQRQCAFLDEVGPTYLKNGGNDHSAGSLYPVLVVVGRSALSPAAGSDDEDESAEVAVSVAASDDDMLLLGGGVRVVDDEVEAELCPWNQSLRLAAAAMAHSH